MKKIILLVAFVAMTSLTFAQNIQTHYDFGDGRSYVTTTIEMFKPDAWGSTFFFIDYDHNSEKGKNTASDGKNQPSLSYFEIARGLKFWDAPVEMTVEYNGGLTNERSLANAYLAGPAYSWNASDFSKGFTLKALYKHIENANNSDKFCWQLTGVWYYNLPLGDYSVSFTGFADFWKEKQDYFLNKTGEETDFVFLAEPQLWFNYNKHFSLGGEVELSNNFGLNHGFKVCPTLGLKWNF
jgi:hypothetical protein